jgi:hypothetical protein
MGDIELQSRSSRTNHYRREENEISVVKFALICFSPVSSMFGILEGKQL